jgi:hypothetical protein
MTETDSRTKKAFEECWCPDEMRSCWQSPKNWNSFMSEEDQKC